MKQKQTFLVSYLKLKQERIITLFSRQNKNNKKKTDTIIKPLTINLDN